MFHYSQVADILNTCASLLLFGWHEQIDTTDKKDHCYKALFGRLGLQPEDVESNACILEQAQKALAWLKDESKPKDSITTQLYLPNPFVCTAVLLLQKPNPMCTRPAELVDDFKAGCVGVNEIDLYADYKTCPEGGVFRADSSEDKSEDADGFLVMQKGTINRWVLQQLEQLMELSETTKKKLQNDELPPVGLLSEVKSAVEGIKRVLTKVRNSLPSCEEEKKAELMAEALRIVNSSMDDLFVVGVIQATAIHATKQKSTTPNPVIHFRYLGKVVHYVRCNWIDSDEAHGNRIWLPDAIDDINEFFQARKHLNNNTADRYVTQSVITNQS